MSIPCKQCRGTGRKPFGLQRCETCNGAGVLHYVDIYVAHDKMICIITNRDVIYLRTIGQ